MRPDTSGSETTGTIHVKDHKARLRALLRSHFPPPAHLASTISGLSDELVPYENEILRLRTQLGETEANYAILKEHYGGIFEECEGPKDDPDTPEPVVRVPSPGRQHGEPG
ncbi:hypothetical protein B0H13DRAFT_2341315 [Mycena leptocephala]|nr:hypothetical protein B0H13DRAFT_2341315 [Mycena leptocephala]